MTVLLFWIKREKKGQRFVGVARRNDRTQIQEDPGGLRYLLSALPDVVTGFLRTSSKGSTQGTRSQHSAGAQ